MVKALTKIYIYFICLFDWDNAQLFFICSLWIGNKKHLMLCKTTLNYNKLTVKGPVSNTRLLFYRGLVTFAVEGCTGLCTV